MAARISYLFCFLLMLYTQFFLVNKPGSNNYGQITMGYDVSGYYMYLPAAFIYHDLKKQEFGDSLVRKYQLSETFDQSWEYPNGNRVMKYSCGMALMYLPSFTVAHIIATCTKYPADGFSFPYQFFLSLGSFIASLIGLWYFRKLLLIYFNDVVAAIMLIILVLGTNFLNYSTTSLSHTWLFAIYALLILNTTHFYQSPHYKYAIRIGLLYGLAVLIRPSEIIAIIIPLLWGLETFSIKALKERMKLFASQWWLILVSGICAAAIASIQVWYWLYVTGQPLVYSYGEQEFSWLHPHLKSYIFSYRSGWAIYTPMVLLMLVAFIPFLWKGKNKIAVISFFLLNIYIVSAWNIWWYGGTGGRAMIQSYPVILFPLATLVDIARNKGILKWVLTPFVLLFIYFNIWFTCQAHTDGGLYDPEGMSKEYFWAVAGRWKVTDEVQKLKTTDELYNDTPSNMQLVYSNNFETDTAAEGLPLPAIEGTYSAFTDATHNYSVTSTFPLKKKNAKWLRASATFQRSGLEWSGWKMPQFIVQFETQNKVVKNRAIRVTYLMRYQPTKDIYMDIKIPDEPFDKVSIFLWNPGSEFPVIFDNLRVFTFN